MQQVDTRDIAMKALTMIEGHEQVCKERYALIVKILFGVLGSTLFLVVSKLLDIMTGMHH